MPAVRRLSRLVPTAALAATLLTGCVGDTGNPGAKATPTPPPVSLLQDAVAEATGAGSSRLSLTSTTRVGGQDVAFAGEGVYDYTRKTGSMSFEVPGADGQPATGGVIEQRVVGADLYLQLPQQKGVFYKLRLADVAGTSLGGATDPTAALQALAGTTELERAGEERVRDVETVHYRGTYDVQQALAAVQGPARTVLETALRGTGATEVPFDAWVDGEGRLVKLVQTLELPGASAEGEPLRAQTTVELYDFGTAVSVAAPAAASVRDGAPLLAALRAAAPPPPASPAPAKPAPSAPAPSAPAPAATPAG